MKYQKPQMIVSNDISEGVFMASGTSSDATICSFDPVTVTFNEKDYRGDTYRITIKATHNGKTNDRRGHKTVLNFSVPVSNVTVASGQASVSGSNAGTQITLIGNDESHHSEYNLQVTFNAASKPDVSATVSPL